jgi:hypothetical protein
MPFAPKMTTIMHAEIKMLDGKILYGLGSSSPIFGVGASRAVHEGTIAENPTPREDRPTGKYVDHNRGQRTHWNSKFYGGFGTPRSSHTCNNTLSKSRSPPSPSVQSHCTYSASPVTPSLIPLPRELQHWIGSEVSRFGRILVQLRHFMKLFVHTSSLGRRLGGVR